MNVERLKHLITILEAVPVNRFNLIGWRKESRDCGTIACAVGWACLDTKFNNEGLRAYEEGSYCPVFGGYEHWPAVSKFFGITILQAHALFNAGSYKDEELRDIAVVIDRIKDFIGTEA